MIPSNVTLRLLSVQAKGTKTDPTKGEPRPDGNWELHITGIAFGSDTHCLTALAQIIEGLEKSQFFRNARLLSADENKSYTRSAAEFEIISDILPIILSLQKEEKDPNL